MSHSVFTIVSAVRPERERALRVILEAIDQDPAGNGFIRFHEVPGIHFTSFTVFPDVERGALLVFEHNVDSTVEAHLAALAKHAAPGLVAIYQCCAGFPEGDVDPAVLTAYLKAHRRTPHLYHVGTPYRRADSVRAEKDLRRFLDLKADAIAATVTGQTPAEVWRALQKAATVPPGATRDYMPVVDFEKESVSWELKPEPRAWSRFMHWSIAALLGIGALLFVGWLAHRTWNSQAGLTTALVTLSLLLGGWTAILLGWPVKRQWRHPLNIGIWFGAMGWTVSLLPALAGLAGLRSPWWPIGPFLVSAAYIGVFAQLVGRWDLPTPCLGRPSPAPEDLASVQAQEDNDVNNHMSAMVELRPGLYRRLALYLVLWSLKWTWFQTVLRDLSKGRLFTFATVHFAQWVVLDDKRYLFLSNYNHSWSRYLDDFGYITFGLARLWGQGRRSPGLSSLERFKDFSRTWMVPYAVWYRAYPNTSVTQIWNNEQLRLGLLDKPDDARSRELLARLVASEER